MLGRRRARGADSSSRSRLALSALRPHARQHARAARSAIRATTTMAMMSPVDIGSPFPWVARKPPLARSRPNDGRNDADSPAFDLQSHSTHSDGALPPAEVVARAAAAGVELLALTDHDTVDGVPEARAAAREHGIRALARRRALERARRARGPAHPRLRARRHRPRRCCATLEDFRADRGAPHRGDGRPAARARLRARRRPLVARREAGSRSAARTSPTPCSRTPANAERLRARGHRRQERAVPALPRAGRDRLRRALAPDRRARRSRSSTPPAASRSGRTRSGTSTTPTRCCARSTRFAGAGLDGVECFYADPHATSRRGCCTTTRASAGCSPPARPTSTGPSTADFTAFRGFEVHGLTVELGPIGGNTG